ncbi:N-acetylneuraminate lyase [Chlamydia trachomatis]|uniref:N-acetylneuraminate lyase n=2 Tax=Mesomycoplasma hyorhinis TaxID=2100 RepID=A0AAI8ANE8_MESHY|nr:dihydrodipicolinate synthase family protein [Mesomycoplasma hyorhinis]AEC46114.1 N-acetylneuraminate lyase [Mesomycoplasma hyorhinis MCLD]AFX74570.1 N-acetylneuraminate lyase [Mesomycoplasma hyorhinis SK76]AHA41377.1 N-acetylneuraminate lyase [Mesomycoplasma hyorhinis DBS 1050]CRH25047.1 N-acetylneuraminate lyase [Chlamydia trachomatis]AOD25604.1 N-acetylneuraminate lyase [Mesomycoplasma hyorhinis]
MNVHEVVYLGKKAKEFGFDAVSEITPYYYNFSFQEVKSYYEEITKNVDLPLFIYYLPQLAGKKLVLKNLVNY